MERERERNDNPFGGHNAEPGTVKLTRQEIRPTNRPLSLRFPLFLRLFSQSLSLSLSLSSSLLYPRSKLTPGYMQTAIVPSGPVINLLNYITRTRCLSVHLAFLSLFVSTMLFTLGHLFFPFFFINRSKSQQGEQRPLETNGMLIRRDTAVNTIHSLFQTAIRIKIETVRTVSAK